MNNLIVNKYVWLFAFFTFAVCIDEFELQFIKQFGYLADENKTETFDNASITRAISEIQRIGNILSSGVFDNKTLELMRKERCGFSDVEIVQSTERVHNSRMFRWDRRNLTYVIRNTASTMPFGYVRRIMYDCFMTWSSYTEFTFVETNSSNADIRISFNDFKGLENVIATTNHLDEKQIEIVFNNAKQWALQSDSNTKQINLKSAALHQIGHALGLTHTDHVDSVVYPYYQYADSKENQLYNRDILMIRHLYGLPIISTTPSLSTTVSTVATTSTIQTRTTTESREETLNVAVDVCNTRVDAVAVFNNKIFMFRKNKYWQIHLNGSLVDRPRKIREFWPELSSPIDAAVEIGDQQVFFVGRRVLLFQHRRLIHERSLVDLKLPENLNVRLAYTWIYENVRTYIWNETHYWKLNTRLEAEIDYPRLISQIWKGVPNTVTAAFSWNQDLHFVDEGEIYRFDSVRMSVARGYPKPLSQVFSYCTPQIEA
ncbi:ZnMc domain-containing protein [Aphelenchoides besseyi]|nr:ZnMc domain-containing protein [Aphelenchoides besseyi]